MGFLEARRFIGAAVLCFGVSACGGGSTPTKTQPSSPQQHVRTPQSTSYDVDLGGGYSGHLSLTNNNLGVKGGPANSTNQPCTVFPEIPEIQLSNNSNNSFVVGLSTFTITVPCVVQAPYPAFQASFFVLQPLPNNVVAGQKLAKAKSTDVQPNPAAGTTTITFTPVTSQFTVPAKSVSGIVALETSSNSTIAEKQVALPVISNVRTDVTSSQGLGNDKLLFAYSTGTGNPFYQAACFTGAPPSTTSPAPAPVGRPKFFCNLDGAGSNDILFAGTPGSTTSTNVSFTETLPLDASVLGLDGSPKTFTCQTSSQNPLDSTTQIATCASTQFAINATGNTKNYSNIIASNVNDIQICSPATAGTDCNAGAASATTIQKARGDFQVLVADDPTYHPVTGQWNKALLTATITGLGCVVSTSATLPLPPATSTVVYSAASLSNGIYAGSGPYVAFEFTPAKGSGSDSCTISISEDPAYIQDTAGNGRTSKPFTPLLK